MTDKDIQDRPLSYSSLKSFKKSPAHFKYHRKMPYIRTEALIFGSLVDCLLFTPDDYNKQFVIGLSIPKRSNDQKAEWQAFYEDNKGRDIIEKDDLDIAKQCVKAVQNNPLSKRLLDNTTTVQKRIKWTDKKSKLPCILYLDAEGEFDENTPFIWDLKTSVSAEPESFERSAFHFDYQLQAGTYWNGYVRNTGKFPDMYFVIVEKTEPFGVSVMKCTDDFLKLGQHQYRMLMDEMRFCIDTNKFEETYEFRAVNDYYQLDLPGYAKRLLP